MIVDNNDKRVLVKNNVCIKHVHKGQGHVILLNVNSVALL